MGAATGVAAGGACGAMDFSGCATGCSWLGFGRRRDGGARLERGALAASGFSRDGQQLPGIQEKLSRLRDDQFLSGELMLQLKSAAGREQAQRIVEVEPD